MDQKDYPHTQMNQGGEPGQHGQRPVDTFAMHGMNETLPNSTGVLVLGILSIATCFCYGLPGIVMGIIALIMSSSAKKLLDANPDRYSLSSVKNMKAGRVCAIIGLILSALYLVLIVIYFIIIGSFFANPFLLEQMFG